MDNATLHNIYDRLCFALTDYEGNDDEEAVGNGEILYEKIVSIVNDFAEILN